MHPVNVQYGCQCDLRNSASGDPEELDYTQEVPSGLLSAPLQFAVFFPRRHFSLIACLSACMLASPSACSSFDTQRGSLLGFRFRACNSQPLCFLLCLSHQHANCFPNSKVPALSLSQPWTLSLILPNSTRFVLTHEFDLWSKNMRWTALGRNHLCFGGSCVCF